MIILWLFLAGIAAGFINTLAGGGSVLTLPILILAGVPSNYANGTNRIAIMIQNATSTIRFHKYGQLKIKSIRHIAIATIIGSFAGTMLAVNIDSESFDKILGFVFILVLLLMIRPHKQLQEKSLPRWLEFLIFLLVGFYGGFIQVGIGLILLATLNLVEKFSLIKANAVKVFITFCYTIFSVIIFAISGMIIWKYGLILAAGNMLGAFLGVQAAIKIGDTIIKIVLSIAVILACLKLFGVFEMIGL